MNRSKMVNSAKARMEAGDVALGMIVRLARSGDVASIALTTDHDFIFIDAQHAIFSNETIAHIAQAALGCGIAPLVRVSGCDDPSAAVLLDAGVTGIIFPNVNTVEEAKLAVTRCKFAPLGARSVAGVYPFFDFRPVPMVETIETLNRNTLVVCMIETVHGLENVEAIAAVDGVDVLHIGCSDLLVDMGRPGEMGGPEIRKAISRVIAACKRHGKFAGLGGDKDAARQAEFIREGIRFVTTHTDMAFLMTEAARRTGELRSAMATVR
jgi:2-keto-3-deoxy-L-rhamnonate aldolase RhmA